MIAPLAFSKPGKAFLNQATHTIMEIQKSARATAEIIFVKNQTSLCTVVNLNLVSPDMATIRPMMVLSPVAKTTPVHFPWTTKVELNARLRVSIAFSEVDVTVPGIISLVEDEKKNLKKYGAITNLSPVRRERSKRKSGDASMMRISAGTRFPLEFG